jgi:hypothetical protein
LPTKESTVKLKIATSTKKPVTMSFEACADSLRRKLDEALEHQRSAAQLLEHVATVLIANCESRGLVHLEDALEITARTSLAATLSALRARGGYLQMMDESLKVLHEFKRQQRAAP